MTENLHHPVYTDVPINDSSEDQYSFTALAGRVVQHLKSNTSPESIVVVVTGQWGIGKTSMLNLIEEQYKKQHHERDPIFVYSYSPLKDVDRETMLSDFLLVLINQVEAEAEKSKEMEGKLNGKIDNVKRYALAVKGYNSKLRPYFEALSKFGAKQLEDASIAVDKITAVLSDQQGPANIEMLYKKAYDTLLELKIPIVVLIDDIDRLYPDEILGMFTLLRSTGQLPYITYYVSYDPIKVEEAIELETKSNGRDYLEKFIQLLIGIPRVSSNAIKGNILRQVNDIYTNFREHSKTITRWSTPTVDDVISEFIKLGMIKSVRDISKISNAIQMNGVAQKEIHDCESFLQIAILQVKQPSIYEWIESAAWRLQSDVTTDGTAVVPESTVNELESLLQRENLSVNLKPTILNLVSAFSTWEI